MRKQLRGRDVKGKPAAEALRGGLGSAGCTRAWHFCAFPAKAAPGTSPIDSHFRAASG